MFHKVYDFVNNKMKNIFLILLLIVFSNQSFSQNDIYQKTAQISYEIVHEDYQEAINQINQLDTTLINRTVINYAKARCLLGLEQYEKAYSLFEKIYKLRKHNFDKQLHCNAVVTFGEKKLLMSLLIILLNKLRIHVC